MQLQTYTPTPEEGVQQTWFILCSTLILLMQIGFILFETGCVRDVDRPHIAFKNVLIMLASMVCYSVLGYKLMYGVSIGGVVGNITQPISKDTAYPSHPAGPAWQFCQMGYAVISALIISGAIAGRSELKANVVAACVMTLVAYPIVGHWVWGHGWLFTSFAVHDFAGSGVVHVVGGVAAGVAAWVVGPRRDRSYLPNDEDLVSRRDPANSNAAEVRRSKYGIPFAKLRVLLRAPPLGRRRVSLAAFGFVFLLAGWLGFNGGSVQTFAGIVQEGGRYLLATCAAGVGGVVVVLIVDSARSWSQSNALKIDAIRALTGGMGGMVAVTAVCDLLPGVSYGAFVGGLGGIATYIGSHVVRDVLKLDDPTDAVSVHAFAGAVGVLLVAGFQSTSTHPNNATLGGQALYLVAACGLTFTLMLLVFLFLDDKNSARCSEKDESTGLALDADMQDDLAIAVRWQTRWAYKHREKPCARPLELTPPFDPRRIPRGGRRLLTWALGAASVIATIVNLVQELRRL